MLEKPLLKIKSETDLLKLIKVGNEYKLRYENAEGKWKTIPLDEHKMKKMQELFNKLYPLLEVPIEPRVISPSGGFISMIQLCNYLNFASVSELIDNLPPAVKITPFGDKIERAVIETKELVKEAVTTDIGSLKTKKEVN